MLRLDELVVRYGPVTALKGISLHVDEGEVISLVGPNGAGKSTTLNTIAGLIQPASGSLTFDGESIGGEVPERLVRRGIALVPEGRRIFGTLTVAENLHLGATLRSNRASVDADLKKIFQRFPILETYYGSQADRLSGGEQQQSSNLRSRARCSRSRDSSSSTSRRSGSRRS
jgi:branched-chain amino acid transport system ATP-binding protein